MRACALVLALFLAAAATAHALSTQSIQYADVVTDWSPFTLTVTDSFDPQSLSLPLMRIEQAKSRTQARLEVIRVRKAPFPGLRHGALIEYAISGPPSGMFRYTLKGKNLHIREIGPFASEEFGTIYIPPAPPHRTQLSRGAQFADVYGSYGEPMRIFTVAGAKPLRGSTRVVLLSGDGARITLNSSQNTVFGLPNLLPVENDANVVNLRRRFVRGRAWALGKVGMYCGGQPNPNDSNQPNLQVIDDRSVPIKQLFRVRGLVVDIAAGSPDSWQAEEAFHFFAVDPVVIVYARKWPGCASSFWLLADTWQVNRFFSPVSVDQAHPYWTASIRSALKLERVRPGMTHEMVAWARGYPLDYGTVESLNAKQRWDYDTMAKYAQWAIFKGDRLVEYHGTGGWPK
ncbi:MAG: hypothetical protein GIW97_00440 [Candidatus Eremiobacteraeota bacterium]|nr:hypothetical protein [Candidatus Eremiobacteraeota bacterium]